MTIRPLELQAVQALALLLIPAFHADAQAPTLTTLYNFTGCTGSPGGCDGIDPYGPLAIGSGGVLYGVTVSGGDPESYGNLTNVPGGGTVFSLTPPATAGGKWTENVLYRFLGAYPAPGGTYDGASPLGVVVGSGGVLYGATREGGTGVGPGCQNTETPPKNIGCGTVFSLTPPAKPGGPWTEAVLWDFGAGSGPSPNNVVIGGGGVLYGTMGGDCGYVFSLAPPTTPGGQWGLTALYGFTSGAGTCGSNSGVVIGEGGLLYGAEYAYGPPQTGMVFSLAPPAPGQPWIENALYNFPIALSVTVASGGVLYGTAATATAPYGIVFSLAPPTKAGGVWTEATLYTFTATDGSPVGGLAVGNGGVLYGVAYPCNGAACGELFSLTPPTTPGGAWTKATLHNFTGGSDGGAPGSLVIGSDATIYGTTETGGTGGDGTVFSLKLAVPEPTINAGGLVSAASYSAPVAPGSIASVFGDFFVSSLSAMQSPLPASLSGLSLAFGTSTPAPLFFVSGGQVNLQIPWELAGQPQANLDATLNGLTGTAQTVNLATFAPAIFTMNAQGSGQGAILDASNHLVDASNPATPGSTVLQIFCTGLGPVTNQPETGSPAPLSPPAYTTTSPTVTIGGAPADVTFSGLAPGYVGLYQVNAQVPAGLAPNTAAPVVISMQGTASNTVTIAVE